MSWRHRPIKHKLIWITMWASSCALVLAMGAIVAYELSTYRDALANDLLIRLKVLEINNAAPLAFHDPQTARENLAPLRADPRLVAAVIYDRTGARFADYRRTPETPLPTDVPDVEGVHFGAEFLDLSMPVRLDGETIGRIALRADLTERNARLRSILLISMGVLAASCAVAFLIASRLQRTISGPVEELTIVAHRVTQQQDYTVQAVKRGDDEIGALAESLNAMLTQIHERDVRLQHYSETLEKQVEERTEALSRANRTLSEREARYRHLVDHAHDIICRLDTQGRFVYFNPTAMRLTQFTAEELSRRSYLHLVHPDYRRRAARFFRRQLVRQVQTTTSEFPVVAKGGEILWINQTVQPLMEEDRLVGFQAIGRDVTERKTVEAALQRAHMELERLVAARTAELEKTVERLQREIVDRKQAEAALHASQTTIRQMQKMEAIGQLAGGIAHDFNNILTAIMGNAALAHQKLGADHPAQPHLDRVLEAGQRATGVVQQILTFTRQNEFTRTVVALAPMVKEVMGLLRATLPAGVELTTTIAPDTPSILADATQLHQVLMNLCTNAWHALGEHPGTIAIDVELVQVTQPLRTLHTLLPAGRYARLSVRDSGCGMSQETIERIFDPFFTTKPVGQGTGLGLSVVHGIVQGHDGGIVVESHLGLGTTFHLHFPAIEVEAERAGGEVEPTPTLERSGCRLLYLDDEEMLVDLVKNLLEPRGFQVTGFTRAQEAIEAVTKSPHAFDVLVTDFNMPGMSGVDVAGLVGTIRPDLPVILVSGYLTPMAHEAALASNVREIVYKPTMLQDIQRVVARLLDEVRQA